jgi:glycosyltransferase involved in cell wall biosynthesis
MTTPASVLLILENVSLGRDHRLRKHAAALLEAGMRVTVICRRDPANHSVPGVRVLDYRAPTDGASRLAFVREYLYSLVMAAVLTVRAMAAGGVDVVQVSSTPDIYFLLAAPLRLLGRKVVFDFKDLSPEIYQARYGRRDGAAYRLLRRLERASLRAADHVVAVNGAVRDVAVHRGGVPAGNVTVVGNGPRLAQATRRPPRPELRRGFEHLCVLVGMMGPQDGIDLGVEAVAHLVHTLGRTDCAFTFVGVGDAVADAQRLVERHGLGRWVTFPGWAEPGEVADYLSTADVGMEPNLETFVTPVKAMEYMAFGLPFVAFDVAETRLVAGGAAALATPGDPADFARLLDELLADHDRRAELGRTGRRAVERRLAWDHQQAPYVALVEGLAAARRRVERRRPAQVDNRWGTKGDRA